MGNYDGVGVVATPDGVWHRDSHYRSQPIGGVHKLMIFIKEKLEDCLQNVLRSNFSTREFNSHEVFPCFSKRFLGSSLFLGIRKRNFVNNLAIFPFLKSSTCVPPYKLAPVM